MATKKEQTSTASANVGMYNWQFTCMVSSILRQCILSGKYFKDGNSLEKSQSFKQKNWSREIIKNFEAN